MQVRLRIRLHCVDITGYSYSNMPACPICAHTGKVRRKGANCGWFVTIEEIAIPKVQSKADNTNMVSPGFRIGFIINEHFKLQHTQHPFFKTDADVIAGTTIREVPVTLIARSK
jgi:hypothetical protein